MRGNDLLGIVCFGAFAYFTLRLVSYTLDVESRTRVIVQILARPGDL